MLSYKVFPLSICILICIEGAVSVLNNGKSVGSTLTSTNTTSNTNGVDQSVQQSTSSEQTKTQITDRILNDLQDSADSSYNIQTIHNPELPIPVYGVPDGPSANVVYPTPPPDIPPAPPISSYGPPPVNTYGSPKPIDSYGPPPSGPIPNSFDSSSLSHSYRVPLPPSKSSTYYGPPPIAHPPPSYGPPKLASLGLPHTPVKFSYGPPLHGPRPLKLSPPKIIYGPPKKLYGPPKQLYGPPSKHHGVYSYASHIKPIYAGYGPPKEFSGSLIPPIKYGPPLQNFKIPPSNTFGTPQIVPLGLPPSISYGIPHRPSPTRHHGHHGHHGPAPPTPPNIKYDGWQPIPGPVSRPNTAYGVPDVGINSFDSNGEAIGNNGISISDSYAAPLNSVTGAGGIVSSITTHTNQHSSSEGISGISTLLSGVLDGSQGVSSSYGLPNNVDTQSLQVLKSVALELPTITTTTTYAGNTYLPPSGGGLLSSSGIYGVPPGGSYGIPPPAPYNLNKPVLNGLDINPPISPIVFREPVPQGLIQSIGETVKHRDVFSINQNHESEPTYIPPPISDKPISDNIINLNIHQPSGSYGAPSSYSSFQSINHISASNSHSSSSIAQSTDLTGANLQSSLSSSYGVPQALPLHSENSQIGNIATSYDVPLQTSSFSTLGSNQNAHSLSFEDISTKYGLPSSGQSFSASSINPSSSQTQAIDLQSTNYANGVSTLSNTYGVPNIQGHDCKFAGFLNGQSHYHGHGGHSDNIASYTTGSLSIQDPRANTHESNSDQVIEDTQHLDEYAEGATIKSNVTVSPEQSYYTVDTNSEGHIVNFRNTAESSSNLNTIEANSQKSSIGIQTIPIQGQLGSYTLQIQSADGLNGDSSSENISHEQVLSDGLLQTILQAIEQPKVTHLSQPIQSVQVASVTNNDLETASNGISFIYPNGLLDNEARNIILKTIQNPKTSNDPINIDNEVKESNIEPIQTQIVSEDKSDDVDDKEIALYFQNLHLDDKSSQINIENNLVSTLKSDSTENDDSLNGVRNGQQYGSYVKFETPNSNFKYGTIDKSDTDKPQDLTLS